jgi:hypothetical protein
VARGRSKAQAAAQQTPRGLFFFIGRCKLTRKDGKWLFFFIFKDNLNYLLLTIIKTMNPVLVERFYSNNRTENKLSIGFILFIIFFMSINIHGQENGQACKVNLVSIATMYAGDCKNGLANGHGVAKGIHRYVGNFKDGLPNGNGTYYFSDSVYYTGNFQAGIKEGKGELYDLTKKTADSLLKGYWSGNEYRGKKYLTYEFNSGTKFDRWEVVPSLQTGNSITFELATTSGSPKGLPSDATGDPGYVLTLTELHSDDPLLKFIAKADNPTISYSTYEISKFPVILYGTLSNGEHFQLDLYKSAKWKVRFFINK